MFNLLRMDLYRLKRTRSVYICLAFLFATIALCYWMIWMITTDTGKEFAAGIGAVTISGQTWENDLLEEGYNTLSMLRDACMNGGAYCCVLGLVTALFVCSDFNSGFIKNIMSLHRNRWKYVASKLFTAGILNFIYLTLLFGFSLLMNLFFQNLFPYAGITDCLFYLSWAWIITTAFATLTILISIFTRSTAAGVASTLLLGSGVPVIAASSITGLFQANGWFPYTLYYNITYGPSACAGIHDLKIYAIGIVFVILYYVLAGRTLSVQDI